MIESVCEETYENEGNALESLKPINFFDHDNTFSKQFIIYCK